MLQRLRLLREIWKVYRAGEYLGDLAILKSALKPLVPTPQAAVLATMPRTPPDFSDLDLATMPAGSLDHAYAQFMRDFGLRPFRFSGRYAELLEQHDLAVRYACVHDLFHVLSGFDTSLSDQGFAAGQEAQPLLFQDFRALLPLPLAEVRATLKVRPATVAAWRAP